MNESVDNFGTLIYMRFSYSFNFEKGLGTSGLRVHTPTMSSHLFLNESVDNFGTLNSFLLLRYERKERERERNEHVQRKQNGDNLEIVQLSRTQMFSLTQSLLQTL